MEAAGAVAPLPLLYWSREMPFTTTQVILHQKSKSRRQCEYSHNTVLIFYIGQHWTLSTDPTLSQAV